MIHDVEGLIENQSVICVVAVCVVYRCHKLAVAKFPAAVLKTIGPRSHDRSGEGREWFIVWRCDYLNIAVPEAHQRSADWADLSTPKTVCRRELQNLTRNESAHINNNSGATLLGPTGLEPMN
jgi:hypothetical protein